VGLPASDEVGGVKLIPISEYTGAAKFLYRLLEERDPVANISHRVMPTWEEHLAFIASRPYQSWWFIDVDGEAVGAIYLTERHEIGVAVLRQYQRRGYASAAVRAVIDMRLDKLLANVAPGNEASRKMFEKLGFKLVQHTLALEAE
jgi:RimJ/RimL family protein N-acetyltransferase